MSEPLLSVRDLVVEFDTPRGPVRAVDRVSFELAQGERQGVVGESGSGKSVLSRTVMGLTGGRGAKVSGEVVLNGQRVLELSERRRRALWGREVAMVFQDPLSALHPIATIGAQVIEAVRRDPEVGRSAARARAVELLEMVGIPRAESRMKARAGELSGGMRQRVMIAMAMACKPQLLIADEPTTALDVTVQARVLKLFDELCDEFGIGLILVSHDLRVVGSHTDNVAVMYAGRLVEIGAATEVFERPMMRYSRALMDAIPRRDPSGHELPEPIPGTPPNLLAPPPGCPFSPRCAFAADDCRETRPELTAVPDQPGHSYACLHPASPVGVGAGAGEPGGVAMSAATAVATAPVLELRGGSVTYREPGGGATEVVTDVSLSLRQGEILGLVGESGCGKSTTARAMLGLAPLSAGTVFVHGEEVAPGGAELQTVAQAIFQNPTASFNPRRSLVDSVIEPLRVRGEGDKVERRARALEELERVGISEQIARRRPREVSGGQCQRAAIARATVVRPEALICDEPVSALDVSIQAQILALLAELRQERGIAMLFISHDLSVVASLCDRTAVMCAGKIVENGDSLVLSQHGRHPYTVILHDSVPTMGAHESSAPRLEPTAAPDDVDGRGCRFAALCPRVTEECNERPPELLDLEDGHGVACFHPVPTEPQGSPAESGS